MRHPSKVRAYCSRKFRNRTDTSPTGTGRMPTKVTGKRGRRHRVPPYVRFGLRLLARAKREAVRRAKRTQRKAELAEARK